MCQSLAGGDKTTSTAINFENELPPVPWWNPLNWPLPCGIVLDDKLLRYWFAHWCAHESDFCSEQIAIQAESLIGGKDEEVKFWEYDEALHGFESEWNDAEPRQSLQSALASTVLDLRFISLASVVTPKSVSLLLIPKTFSDDASYYEISTPILPARLCRSLADGVKTVKIEKKPIGFFHTMFSDNVQDPSTLMFLFTIQNPFKQLDDRFNAIIDNLLNLSDYRDMGQGILIWGEKKFSPPLFRGEAFEYENLVQLLNDRVQSYLLVIRLPDRGVKVLDKLTQLLERNWKELVFAQCYRQMRERMTLFATAMITIKQAEHLEMLRERERLMAYASHTVYGPIADALQYLSFARDGIEVQKNIRRAKLRIFRVQRNAHTILTVLKSEQVIDECEETTTTIDVRKEILLPLLAEIQEDREVVDLPKLLVDFEKRENTFFEISLAQKSTSRPRDVLELLLTVAIQNAVEHIDTSIRQGKAANDSPLVFRMLRNANDIVVEIENGGMPVTNDLTEELNKVKQVDDKAWGISRKGASHYGIGIGKMKWLASNLGGRVKFSSRNGNFVVLLCFPKLER
jgi:hypothetical protein